MDLMQKLQRWALGLCVSMLFGVGCYAWGRSDGRALNLSESLRDAQVAAVAFEAAQQGAAKEIAKLEVRHVTIQQAIEREVREVPVYGDCHHSPDGLRQLNAALTNTQPAGGGELP